MEEDANGARLVVRNTFLELLDDQPALGPIETNRRPRAQTDLTDSKMPQKVGYNHYGRGGSGGVNSALGLGSVAEDGFPPGTSAADFMHMGIPPFMVPPGPYGYPPLPPPHMLPGAWEYMAAAAAAGVPPYPGFPPVPWGAPGFPGGAPPGGSGGSGHGQRGGGAAGGPGGREKKGMRSREPSDLPLDGPLYLNAGSPGGAGSLSPMKGRGSGGKGGRGGAGGFNGKGGLSSGGATPAGDMTHAHSLGQDEDPENVPDTHTTVMLRNIPNRYTQSMLLSLLEEHSFANRYDFVYLPMDFRNGVNLGYAFVNLLTHEDAKRLMNRFQGFNSWFLDSAKVCETSWARPIQGLLEHVERYRNSPVMHSSMPDEYKPMVFQNGERVPFPPPTKAIRAPKLRPIRDRMDGPGPRGPEA
eukprot:TRINITY_DN45331_c0_g1_i1.p1 TRINITY_DN45331_c0_g1~~TRINITY_DN45331_c0_g1_i1.p1  ORF type:complete len:429 (+),score=62.64 TRINITY_DN45331_c0_g1_i1:49-1287(+)